MTYLFTFSGRMSRRAFWVYHYGIMGFVMFPLFICAILSFLGFPNWIWWAVLAGFFAQQTAALSIVVRRFHDRNLSGWWVLVPGMAPLLLTACGVLLASILLEPYQSWALFGGPLAGMAVALWAAIELFFRSGTPGSNRYGPPPSR